MLIIIPNNVEEVNLSGLYAVQPNIISKYKYKLPKSIFSVLFQVVLTIDNEVSAFQVNEPSQSLMAVMDEGVKGSLCLFAAFYWYRQ